MKTQFIGVKDFRQNMAEYAKKARSQKTRYVVVSHKKPLFAVAPFAENESLDSLFDAVTKAKTDVSAGRVLSHEKMMSALGLE